MENKINLAFASTTRYEVDVIPQNVSKIVNGKDFVAWGNDNRYCDFLSDLYANSSTLSSIINGTVDFVCGNEVSCPKSTGVEEDIEDIMRNVIRDYIIYGCAYVNVLRNSANQEVAIKWLDARDIRSNEDNTVFFYSEDWSKSYGRVKTIVLPKYVKDTDVKSSVLMIKDYMKDVYPTPIWGSAINAVVTETKISDYHLNEITNGFVASAVINFNNGTPEKTDIEEIEKLVQDKFCGEGNVGRFVLSFNANKESATTIERLNTDDFADRYNSLEKSVRQAIFTAFRANPNLFGIATENLGFSQEEYESSFRLYNRTMVRPLQKKMVREFGKIGWDLTIVPFSLDEDNNEEEKVDE